MPLAVGTDAVYRSRPMSRASLTIEPHTEWAPAVRARRRLGHSIEVHESIGSTNDRARELLEAGDGDGTVVLAEEQTAGRGRHGRSWVSPSGHNLTLSVGIRPRLAAGDAWQLALATALAALDSCRTAAPDARMMLKWPNDVVSGDGLKVGGLLVETSIAGDRVLDAVLGIGLNVNWRRSAMPSDIVDRTTSLAELVGSELDRVDLLGRLLDALDDEISLIERRRSPLERYRAACATIGQSVSVATADGPIVGHAVDLDAMGSLVLDVEGAAVVLPTGEVSLVREAVGTVRQ